MKIHYKISIVIISIVWLILSVIIVKSHIEYKLEYNKSITEMKITTTYIKTHEKELKKTPAVYDDLNMSVVNNLDISKNALKGTHNTMLILIFITFVAGVGISIPFIWEADGDIL